MKTIHFDSNDREKMIIEIANKRCEVTPFLSMTDMLYVKGVLKNDRPNYPDTVAEIIANHTNGVFSKSEILALTDATINKYITLCVKSDSVLNDSFNDYYYDDINERFICAIRKTAEYYDMRLSDENLLLSSSVQDQLSSVSQSVIDNLKTMIDSFEVVNNIMTSFQEIWLDGFTQLIDIISNSLDFSDYFKDVSSSLLKVINDYQIPTISKEEKQRLISSYTKWGEYGWTLPPNADLYAFSNPPADERAANQFISTFTTNNEMNQLFGVLVTMKRIKKTDIQEAIDCYNEKHYKPCAMILFSIIDARLIRLQGRAQKGKGPRRKTGKQAVEKFCKKTEPKNADEEMLFVMLDHYNILQALNVVFEHANDFEKQYKIINRNFLDHGMLHRKVTRRDCCMLFLLLYNFTMYLNDYIDN